MYNVYKSSNIIVTDDTVHIRPSELSIIKKIKEPVIADNADAQEISAIIARTKQQSIEIIEQSKKEAELIIENAKKTAEAQAAHSKLALENELNIITQQERKNAYELGLLEGVKKKSDDIERAIAILNEQVKSTNQQTELRMAQFEENLVELTLQVCEKILIKKIESDNTVLLPIISQALNNMKQGSQCTVTVSKEAEPALLELKQSLASAKNFASDMFDIVAKDVPPDFCVIETEDNVLDFSILNQFENLKNYIKQIEK